MCAKGEVRILKTETFTNPTMAKAKAHDIVNTMVQFISSNWFLSNLRMCSFG